MSAALGNELDSPPCDGISSLRFANHADVLLVASWDHHVRLYDATLNKLRVEFKQRAPVLDAAFMDTDAAISGGVDTTVRLHHFNSTLEEVLGNHDLPVKCVEHNPATGLVVSGGWDATLRLWDARAADGHGRCVGTLPLPGRVYAMSTSGRRLVVATADKRIQVYDLRSLRAGAAPQQQRESPLKYQIRTLRCTPDERGYAASSVEGRVALDYFDDAESAASKFAFKCHRRTEGGKELVYPVNALAFHPVHGTFATGGCDGYVNIWDGVAKKRLFVLPKYPSSIAALSFNHDGTLLAIASSYTYEEGDKDHPPDGVYVRAVSDVEVMAKPRAPA